jgi:hypothetical protein
MESEDRFANVVRPARLVAKVEYLYTDLGAAPAWPARHVKPK